MTADEELWAVALAVLKQHGDDAPAHVAERIGELTVQGEVAGVTTWKAIAARLDQIRQASEQPQ